MSDSDSQRSRIIIEDFSLEHKDTEVVGALLPICSAWPSNLLPNLLGSDSSWRVAYDSIHHVF